MAVGGSVGEFDLWLNDKLLSFNADENVFGSYIRSILEGEESDDEKKDALQGILSEMTEDDISKLCQDILEKWTILKEQETAQNSASQITEDVDVKLARLMESQACATTVRNNSYTADERRIREAIIREYGQLSDEENEEAKPSVSIGNESNALQRNTNAQSVAQAEKEKREQAKIESQRKKEKDKEDREKQKQMQQEKKEKRKPQKGERRR